MYNLYLNSNYNLYLLTDLFLVSYTQFITAIFRHEQAGFCDGHIKFN